LTFKDRRRNNTVKLRNLKIGVRLGAGFGIVTVLLVVMIILGIMGLKSMSGDIDDIVKQGNLKVQLAKTASASISEIVERDSHHVIA